MLCTAGTGLTNNNWNKKNYKKKRRIEDKQWMVRWRKIWSEDDVWLI